MKGQRHIHSKRLLVALIFISSGGSLSATATRAWAQRQSENGQNDSVTSAPPTATVPPTATPVPPPPASFCDGRTVSQVSLANQVHNGITYQFNGAKMEYDTARKRWYLNDNGSSWVCAKNPNSQTLGTTGVNLVTNFTWVRSDALINDYINQRQWTIDSGLFDRQFSGNAAQSCFLCGLVRWLYGCFPHGVNILTGDGVTYKKIEEFSAGETVWNPVTKKAVKILNISEGPERKALVVLKTDGATLRASTEHPMFMARGWRQAQEIRSGDILQDSAGEKVKVRKVSRERPTAGLSVINFILERHGLPSDGLMVADGLVVGDLIVQHEISAKRKK